MEASAASKRLTPSAGRSLHAPGDPGSGLAISIRDAARKAEQARDRYRPCQEEVAPRCAPGRHGSPRATAGSVGAEPRDERSPPAARTGGLESLRRSSAAVPRLLLPLLVERVLERL